MDPRSFRPDIVYPIYIGAPPQAVWTALTSADYSRRYFHGFSIAMEPRVNGAFIVRAPDGTVHIEGKVVEHDPPRRLAVTWNVNWPRLVETLGVTLVTYEIEPAGDSAVRLTMTESHEKALSDDLLSGGRQGWPAILSSLKSLLETGEALTLRTAPPQRMLGALQALGIAIPGT